VSAIELLFFVAMTAIGTVSARALYQVGGTWLAIPGFLAGFALIPSMFLARGRYRRWAYRGDKWMPECSCGSSAFKYQKIGLDYHLLCQGCATRYEKRRGEVWVFENGAKKPYKRLVKHQGWI
jgi:hypothetical protein